MSKAAWQDLYEQAILETDWQRLKERITAAERAIDERLSLDGRVDDEERDALQKATASLRGLRQELVSPDN